MKMSYLGQCSFVQPRLDDRPNHVEHPRRVDNDQLVEHLGIVCLRDVDGRGQIVAARVGQVLAAEAVQVHDFDRADEPVVLLRQAIQLRKFVLHVLNVVPEETYVM